MDTVDSEPTLTFKISDKNEFRCSACHTIVASVGNATFVVVGLPGLIDEFKQHVRRCHLAKQIA